MLLVSYSLVVNEYDCENKFFYTSYMEERMRKDEKKK